MFFGGRLYKRAVAGKSLFDIAVECFQVDIVNAGNAAIVFIVKLIEPAGFFDSLEKGVYPLLEMSGLGMYGPAQDLLVIDRQGHYGPRVMALIEPRDVAVGNCELDLTC